MKKILDFDKNKFYPILEAVEMVKKYSTTKFVSSIDIAIKLNLDTAKTEQQLRGTLSLPYFFGKKKKILVLDSNLTKNDAKSLEVDFSGGKEVIDEISKGWLDFDLIITTPKMMPELSKLGKILGTRGLMPSPKNGNVTTNIKKTINDFKSGITQYRTDSYGNIHMLIGKTNADSNKIEENISFILDFLKSKKPSVVKGIYIQNVSISSTMGPGIKINIQKNVELDKKIKQIKKTKIVSKKRSITPIIKVVYEKNTINSNHINKPIVNKKEMLKETLKPIVKPVIIKEKYSNQIQKPILKKQTIAKPIVKPVIIKEKSSNQIQKPISKKQTIAKPIVKPVIVKEKSSNQIQKPISKKQNIAKPIVKLTAKKENNSKIINKEKTKLAKSHEKIKVDKVDNNKVQTNKKITKTGIKKQNISKKIAPRKIEIKK